jgi:hypothetical protein
MRYMHFGNNSNSKENQGMEMTLRKQVVLFKETKPSPTQRLTVGKS